MSTLAPVLQAYFTSYLNDQRAASPATARAYRDTWRLFLKFLTTSTGKRPHTLDLADIDEHRVRAFLDHLERDRGNSIATRNLRLTGIKAVMGFSSSRAPESLDTIARIQAIPVKKRSRPEIAYLTEDGVQALLDAIDSSSWTNRRDRAMFALAAQTGLRVSELTSLEIASLRLSSAAAYVQCIGKGRKQRTTPLTRATVAVLGTYLAERNRRPGTALFPNPHGTVLSPDAISARLHIHVAHAAKTCPELARMNVTVHTLRHTAAMRFLNAGIDASVIALWLGHESTATTNIYLHADIGLKRRALDRTRQPDTPAGEFRPTDPLLAWLEAL